jgi:hypothetical protein
VSDIDTFEKVAFVTNILENDAESPIMLSTSNSDMNPKLTDISSISTYEKVAPIASILEKFPIFALIFEYVAILTFP